MDAQSRLGRRSPRPTMTVPSPGQSRHFPALFGLARGRNARPQPGTRGHRIDRSGPTEPDPVRPCPLTHRHAGRRQGSPC